ncbi:upstream stimulatory factor 1 [Brachionus plicatilis]|uniref:Upstream stimulatory factor 1 n=1 Tax=Brachionus plicatilis TaxID=10195 RepID=A0A3M7QI09_BRAPC|nr:upstream stimulatory factor 1 [Brachionus plicatilis]
MIVPVIEHMEKEMNSTSTLATKSSTTTTARLLNRSDDISSNIIFDENKTTSSLDRCLLEHKENLTSQPITSPLPTNKQALVDQEERWCKKLRKESSIDTTNDDLTCQSSSNSIVDLNNNLKNPNQKTDDSGSDQQTLIIEGGINALQFQLKPEIVPNRQITLKLVPVGSPNQPSLLNDSCKTLKPSENIENSHLEQIQLESTESLDLVSHEGKNCRLNSASIQTVKLAESNQNVYFMMQPIDLISNNHHSNSIKLKSPPDSVSSTTHHYNSHNLSTITLQNLANTTNLNSSLINNNPKTTTVTLGSPVSSTTSINSAPKVLRDERRRANHNEVERRRRDNINKWIVELSKVIPDCCNDQSKHGQSKGGILEKTVQYLLDIKKQNQSLCDKIRCLESLKTENEFLKEKLEEFKKENQLLKMKMQTDSPESQCS